MHQNISAVVIEYPHLWELLLVSIEQQGTGKG
jgi:hypothetical protein